MPSWLAEASRQPSGLNATHPQLSVCSRRPSTSRPVAVSQRWTVLSSPAEARRFLPQGTYPMEHETLGRLEVFLVPLGPDAQGMRYEAVFN